MIVLYDSSVPGQMRQWIADAIARAKPKWDFEANDTGTVTFVVVTEPPCAGHKDYMCTQTTSGDSVVSIREGADDPNAVFNRGVPGPLQSFFEESVVHELGHHRTFTHVLDDATRTAVSALFVKNVATGEGAPRTGLLADWNPLTAAWEDRVQEAVAEAMKDMFLPEAGRVYDNRTHWDLPPESFQPFKDLLGLVATPPGSFDEGSPSWLASDPLGPRMFDWDGGHLDTGLSWEAVTDDVVYGPDYPSPDPGDYIVKASHVLWTADAGAFAAGDVRYPGPVVGAIIPGASPRNPDDYEYVNARIDAVIRAGNSADEANAFLAIGLGEAAPIVITGAGPGLVSRVVGTVTEYTFSLPIGEALARALAKEMFDNGGQSIKHSMRQYAFVQGTPGSPVAGTQGASSISVGLVWTFADEAPVDVPYPYGDPVLTAGQGPTGVMRLASGGRR